jgi:hypothetical protein
MERTPKFNSPLLIGGKVSGSWRRDLKKDVTKIEVASFGKLKAGGKEEVIRAAERYGRFIRLRVECLISPDPKSS